MIVHLYLMHCYRIVSCMHVCDICLRDVYASYFPQYCMFHESTFGWERVSCPNVLRFEFLIKHSQEAEWNCQMQFLKRGVCVTSLFSLKNGFVLVSFLICSSVDYSNKMKQYFVLNNSTWLVFSWFLLPPCCCTANESEKRGYTEFDVRYPMPPRHSFKNGIFRLSTFPLIK